MGTYRMVGNKTPGGSANETGSNLPPSLTSWTQDGSLQANMDNFAKGLERHVEEGKENRAERKIEKEHLKKHDIKGKKKRRFKKNAPETNLENQEFIKAGGGSRPAFS